VPPEFLADRDLGKGVVAALRDAGMIVHTLPEMFGGEAGAMQTLDVEWIELAGRNHWAALSKNKKIRYNLVEQAAVAEHRVPLFALVSGNLSLAQMVTAFLAAMPRILQHLEEWPGGTIWLVYRDGQVRLCWPEAGPPIL
jgi:hypothetical protein